jgi:serine/threonine protein kinase
MMVLPKLDLRRLGESMSAAVLRRKPRDLEKTMDAAALDAALDDALATIPESSEPRSAPPAAAPRSVWSTQAAQTLPGTAKGAPRAPGPSTKKSIRQSGLWRTARAAAYERELDASLSLLRTYLAVLLRSHDRTERAIEIMREELEQGESRALEAPPGPRARLFRLARRTALADAASSTSVEHAPWDAAPPGRAAGYGRLLDHARGLVSLLELETLLLTIGLALSDEEAAFVLELDASKVHERRESSRAWIALQLEGEPAARGLDVSEVIADALRVLPPPDVRTTASGPPRPLPSGSVIAGRYEIESVVGGGAFGHVYRARDRRVHTHVVALKMAHRASLTEAAKEGAMAELSRIASAFHPSLVQLKEHGWHDERLWFAMPFYEGETLAERLARGPLPVEEAAALLAPIAEALASLHRAGIRHQDIKPDNIFVAQLDDQRTLPVLLDLGVAARAEDLAVAGTPAYFAPEVARRVTSPDDHVAVDDRADVFALALTFAQAIAPDLQDEEVDLDAFLRERAAAVPRFVDTRLLPVKRALVRWAAENAKERPSASELATELHALSRRHATPPRAWRSVALGAALTLAAVALALGVAASMGVPLHTLGVPLQGVSPHTQAAQVSTVAASPPPANLVERARTVALEQRLEAAESRAAALEERLTACH